MMTGLSAMLCFKCKNLKKVWYNTNFDVSISIGTSYFFDETICNMLLGPSLIPIWTVRGFLF